jgi:hypothetical protein
MALSPQGARLQHRPGGETTSLNKFNKVQIADSIILQEDNRIAIGLEAIASVIHCDIGAKLSGNSEGGHCVSGE